MGSGNWDPKYENEYTVIIRIKNVKIVDYKKRERPWKAIFDVDCKEHGR